MRKLKYTLKEKKVIVILMTVNLFALAVNFVGIRGVMNGYYTFTNCRGFAYTFDLVKDFEDTKEVMNTFYFNYFNFWPFINFTKSNEKGISEFNGIFRFFDFTEFAIYTILIFGTPLLIKFMKSK